MSQEKILFIEPSVLQLQKNTIVSRFSILTGGEIVSISDQIQKEAVNFGLINPTENELQIFANTMRVNYGDDIFARLVSEEIIKNKSGRFLLIDGICNPNEIGIFGNASIIGIDTPKNEKNKRECLLKADFVFNDDMGSVENSEYVIDLIIDHLLKTGSIKDYKQYIPSDNKENKKKKILVMNGHHGTGKTTIGRLVSQKFGNRFLEEIGGRLREEVAYGTLDSKTDFDREVMRRELLRDHQLLRTQTTDIPIIETWHTGNIAYAMKRSPDLIAFYLKEFVKQLSKFDVFHILITVDNSTFFSRIIDKLPESRKKELADFYREITQNTRHIYNSNNLEFEEVENSSSISMAENKTSDILQKRLDFIL